MSAGVIAASRRRSSGGPETINGNFQIYSKNPYGAYTGMWGMNNPEAPGLVATSSMVVDPATMPNGTTFNWNVTPSPSWGGINGYLYISYGNYDGSPGVITPRQVKDIGALTVNATWTQSGDLSSALLSEIWLAAESAASGAFTKLFEIAFFPRFSVNSKSWIDSLSQVGTGFTSGGVSYKVREAGNPQGVPYIIAYRSDYGDMQGGLPYKDFFTYLIAQGRITGNEWFNGVAYGVEPDHGIGSLTINTMSVDYTGITARTTAPTLTTSPTLVTSS